MANSVHLVNIGHSILLCTVLSDGGRLDLKFVDRLVIRFMEIETCLKSPSAFMLDKHEIWSSGTAEFLEGTFASTLKYLLDV